MRTHVYAIVWFLPTAVAAQLRFLRRIQPFWITVDIVSVVLLVFHLAYVIRFLAFREGQDSLVQALGGATYYEIDSSLNWYSSLREYYAISIHPSRPVLHAVPLAVPRRRCPCCTSGHLHSCPPPLRHGVAVRARVQVPEAQQGAGHGVEDDESRASSAAARVPQQPALTPRDGLAASRR